MAQKRAKVRVIDRSNPGHMDEIGLSIHFPVEGEIDIIFKKCYHAHLHFNFGIIAEETLLDFWVSQDDEGVTAIKKVWQKMGVTIENLSAYCFQTNSTNSIIKIFAKDYVIVPR